VCGGTCVDILSDARHCGGSCTVCASSKPKCAAGVCVQCTSAADCTAYGADAACSASNTCQCHPPKPSNLLQNPSFEGGTTGWTPSPGGIYTSDDDADGCFASGSIHTKAISVSDWGRVEQCVPVSASKKYYFGYDYKQEQASSVYCRVDYYAGTSCSGSALGNYNLHPGISTPALTWTYVAGETTSPAGVGSAKVMCSALGTAWGAFDQIFLDPSYVGY
jgi:hypothetical protein